MASDLGGRHIICTLTVRMAATEGPLNSLFENKALSKPKKDEKRLSVERIYHQKTQLEYILLRPDTYIGSVEHVTQQMWVFDEDVGMNCRDITYVPGHYKIFDEILGSKSGKQTTLSFKPVQKKQQPCSSEEGESESDMEFIHEEVAPREKRER
ncbi:DNA topoisomerase 2-alpha-like isoform X3 [Cyprinus carpio]|uniref:DNA topoisomerase 2-alpha-like isoform X3 n=1 Tax=Cyprinus carpio TaxID=7962 RepID=A0A9Q9YN36_CYPCA|nr:DNA topoisomerase 2-alpha-like isoform X3 [Cyprinus carpio]XP_042623265.1 DNA topoisomerase 2-alpha-like isoform X3 [Cyprinus carpio]